LKWNEKRRSKKEEEGRKGKRSRPNELDVVSRENSSLGVRSYLSCPPEKRKEKKKKASPDREEGGQRRTDDETKWKEKKRERK